METLPDFNTLSMLNDQQLQQIFGVRDLFTYEVDIASITAAGGTATGSFTVQADSNFLWQRGMLQADVSAASLTYSTNLLPLVTCTILDSSSGRQLMNSAVPVGSLFGPWGHPQDLPTPRFFRAQTQVTVSLTSYVVSGTYGLRLSFIGTKFFKFAQSN